MTCQPRSSSSLATAAPMPELVPVTRARRSPLMLFSSSARELLKRPRFAHVAIERRHYGEEHVPQREHDDGRDHAEALDQKAGQRRADRHHAEGKQSESAVHPTLQRVRNERQAIAELHDVVDGSDEVYEGKDHAQEQILRHDRIERKEQRLDPYERDDGLAEAEALLHATADERPEDAADAADAEDEADIDRPRAEVLGEKDHNEAGARVHEIDAPGEERHVPNQRLTPQPAQAFADLAAQVRLRLRGPRRAKRRADEHERDDGNDVGDRVGDERRRTSEPLVEERPEGRADDMRGGKRGFALRRSLRQLVFRHHAGQRRHLGDVEEDEEAALDERRDIELPHRKHIEPQRDGNARHGECATHIATDHGALAIPAVDERARGQRKEEVGQVAERRRDAGCRRRTRHRQDKQRIDDVRSRGAEGRDHLPAPEQHVIAVAKERRQLHASSWMRARTLSREIFNSPTATGSVRRRGPALPGLTYSTPSRFLTIGLCEWPETTTLYLPTGSMSSSARLCNT